MFKITTTPAPPTTI